jgi:hypothetical protein
VSSHIQLHYMNWNRINDIFFSKMLSLLMYVFIHMICYKYVRMIRVNNAVNPVAWRNRNVQIVERFAILFYVFYDKCIIGIRLFLVII